MPGLPQPAAQPSRLLADSVRYEDGVIIAEGSEARPVRLENGTMRVTARIVRLNINDKSVKAEGNILVERQREVTKSMPGRSDISRAPLNSSVTETLTGDSLVYDFKTRTGHLDNAFLRLTGFNVSTTSLTINGQRYIARKVILRPGGLTPAEEKIYGKPPFNVRVGTLTVDSPTRDGEKPRVEASGAALYYKNTRLLPVPHFVYRLNQGEREQSAFQITPGVSVNSADRFLITTRVSFPLTGASAAGNAANPNSLALNADIGLSARVGFRGGLSLDAGSKLGTFTARGMLNDIVSTRLNNDIKLDRLPELRYNSPALGLFKLPGGRRVGVALTASIGRYKESLIGGTASSVSGTREHAGINFTTRLNAVDGPYLDLFARASRYPSFDLTYRNTGYEIGYEGKITNRLRGQFSYRHTALSGNTPFLFDEVELAREARATFDVQVTPRWIIPIDLRYDLDRKEFRDQLFGLLRSYKVFAYGVTYNTARREVKLAFRNGF